MPPKKDAALAAAELLAGLVAVRGALPMLAALAGMRMRRACCGWAASSGESRSRAPPTAPAAMPAHSHPPAHTARARNERSDTRALPHPHEFGHDEMKLLYQIYKDFWLEAATEDTVLEQ